MQGTKTSIDSNLISAIGSGIRGYVDNWLNGWFGPGEPVTPVAPPGQPARVYDYPTGVNLRYTPRQGELVGYEQMRLLADQYDLLRIVIESRKAQLAKMPMTFALKQKPGESLSAEQSEADTDPRLQQLEDFFAHPDGEESTWCSWLNEILEEVFVVDALSVYPAMNVEVAMTGITKTPERFEIIDGATIKRVLTPAGRTPSPDAPPPNNIAYQQILKGVVASNMTTDQLIYRPMNRRAHKMYGYSPVEQIIMTVNIALRRQMHQLSYYTEGTIPDAICQLPSDWSADDCKRYQNWFDGLMTGNLAKRRKMWFLPGSGSANSKASISFTKDQILKDEMDEWLARVVCYCFSIPPTAFSKMTNRASGQQMQETAIEEGLEPLMMFIKALIDHLIAKYFGWTDIEFLWEDDAEEDSLKQAQVNEIYVKTGVLSIDEIREQLGKPALGIENGIVTATGFVPLAIAIEQAQTSLDGAKKALAAPTPDPNDPNAPQPSNSPSQQPPKGTAKGKAVSKLAKKKLLKRYTSPSSRLPR